MMKTFGGWFRTLRNIQSDAENGYYIIGSYQKILFIGCIYWGALIVLLASTTIVTSILTIPILAYWTIRYIVFCQWWRNLHLSKVYLLIIPIISAIIAILIRWLLKSVI